MSFIFSVLRYSCVFHLIRAFNPPKFGSRLYLLEQSANELLHLFEVNVPVQYFVSPGSISYATLGIHGMLSHLMEVIISQSIENFMLFIFRTWALSSCIKMCLLRY